MFTKFSVWDKEVRKFIDDVSKYDQTQKAAIEAWFYKEGMLIFQKSQNASYSPDVKTCQEKFKHRPIITTAGMLGNVFIAFSQLRDEFFKAFLFSAEITPEITLKFNSFITEAVSAHLEFYGVRADVTNQLHEYLDANPNTSPASIPDVVIGFFESYKMRLPVYGIDIDANILAMREYMSYMKAKNAAGSSSSVATQAQQSASSSSTAVIPSTSATPYSFLGTLSDKKDVEAMTNGAAPQDTVKLTKSS